MTEDPRLRQAVIPVSVLSGLVELADIHGQLTDRWFSGTGLTAEQLALPETRASFRQVSTVVRRALQALPPGPIGMQVGSRDALLSFGLLGFAIRSCPTSREALALGVELHQAAGSLMDIQLEYGSKEFAIRLTERAPEPDLLPFLCEEAFCSQVMLARALDPRLEPTRLELSYPAPPYAAAYQRFFRCPIEFDAPANQIHALTEHLDLPIPTANPAHLAATLAATRQLVDPAETRPDVVAAVEGLLRQDLREPPTMEEVAQRLCITERGLRRQLAALGHRFSDLRDNVRRDRARLLLRESDRPVSAVAAAVGFSDAHEFRRAYQRWTGLLPSQERAASNSGPTTPG